MRRGKLTVVTGPMGSGKTIAVIDLMTRAELNEHTIFSVKHAVDDRDGELITKSRLGPELAALPMEHSRQIEELIYNNNPSVLVIDEAQFFEPRLTRRVEGFLHRGVHVLVCGLNQDFAGRPFGCMPKLMAMADELHLKVGVCDVKGCPSPATKTQRLKDGEPVSIGEPLVLIGGNESYTCRCIDHWVNPKDVPEDGKAE